MIAHGRPGFRPFGRKLLHAQREAERMAARNARPLTSSVTVKIEPRTDSAAGAHKTRRFELHARD